MEPLGNKTDKEDFTAGVPLKCPEKVSLFYIIYKITTYPKLYNCVKW